MRFSRRFLSFVALLLFISVLTARIGAVSHLTFVEPIQNFLSQKALVEKDDLRQKLTFFKIKRLFFDSTSLTAGLELKCPAGSFTRLQHASRFQALPEVYLEIFAPPDNRV